MGGHRGVTSRLFAHSVVKSCKTLGAGANKDGLNAQLRTTDALRETLSTSLFLVDPALVDSDVVYKNQVFEVGRLKLTPG
jgi:hypothetical protein